ALGAQLVARSSRGLLLRAQLTQRAVPFLLRDDWRAMHRGSFHPVVERDRARSTRRQLGGCCWICTGVPPPSGVPGAMTRYRRGAGPSPRTSCRIGPTALTTAAPAGFVVKLASGSSGPVPAESEDSASTYRCFGSRPVVARSPP